VNIACRFAYALVPIGFSMWLAHYGFHLVASFDAAFYAIKRFVADVGWPSVGDPAHSNGCCTAVAEWLPRMEILILDFGLLFSLYTAYHIALGLAGRRSRTLAVLTPWSLLIVLLFAAGVWIVLQPMQMRGSLSVGG
jgi:hypothetical protein